MLILRDISWLSFNERVMQEAKDPANHLHDRLRFLGIFSNNQDEFFRVRVAALNRMARLGKKAKMHLEENPALILHTIQHTVIRLQREFDVTYHEIIEELSLRNIFIRNEKELDRAQTKFIGAYFEQSVRTQIVPLMIEGITQFPLLHDKKIYLACVLSQGDEGELKRFALIEVPTTNLPRFVLMPSRKDTHEIILIEDIIRHNLPQIFSAFACTGCAGYIIKVTRDAELDLDNDINANTIEALEKGLKNRKKGKATRFVYDRDIDPALLAYLTKRMQLNKRDNLIPGGRIHNFKDFIDFPGSVFRDLPPRQKPFAHPDLVQPCQIMEVLNHRDILLHFPYHSFDSIIDLLREAAIDPLVESIHITCYRLSRQSKIINALINAARNGKKVVAVIELKARFDEKANLAWKALLEEEGVKVVTGMADQKVHAKLCVIKKAHEAKVKEYAFISTGNLNEDTALSYGDHCLLTSNRKIIADVKRIFQFLENHPKGSTALAKVRTLAVAPGHMRDYFLQCIDTEIRAARNGHFAEIKIKLNSLVDKKLIEKLYEAATEGVRVHLIVRGVCCAVTRHSSYKRPIHAISIIDEYLEHARVFIFHNRGTPRVFISSADWMVRNLDHRIEVACPITPRKLKKELIDIINLQLSENVKGRVLDNDQKNHYVRQRGNLPAVRTQRAIYHYLSEKAGL